MDQATRLPPSYRLFDHDVLGSTNDEARRLAGEGAPEGTLVRARTQTAGRGRRGRHWDSPPGNLHCSLILRPTKPLIDAAEISFVAALALGEALASLLPASAQVRFKWPNDVLVNGAKAAGILLESSGTAGRTEWVIVGVGVNVAAHPTDTPYPATSLGAAGGDAAGADGVLERFCRKFRLWYETWAAEGFAAVSGAWLAQAAGFRRMIEVRLGDERLLGRFVGLDPRGALVVERKDGARYVVTAGDVFFPGVFATAG